MRRPTRHRAGVEALLDINDFMSAQDLHARLRAQGETVGLMAVLIVPPLTSTWRPSMKASAAVRSDGVSHALAADGDVEMMRTDDGDAVYRRCSTGHHHHLVCRSCGRTVEGPAVERWADKVSADNGFSDVQHTVEIVGTCSDCQT